MKPGDLVKFVSGYWDPIVRDKIGLVVDVRGGRSTWGGDLDQDEFEWDALVEGRMIVGFRAHLAAGCVEVVNESR